MISGLSNCLELHWTPFNGVTPLPYEIGDWWPQMAANFTAANLSLELKPELLPMFERVSLESKRTEVWVGRQVGSLVEVPLSDQQGKSCVRYPIHNPAEVTCLQFRRRGLYAGFCPGDQKDFIDIKIFTSRTPDTNISLKKQINKGWVVSPAFLEKGLIPLEEGEVGNVAGQGMEGGGGRAWPVVGVASKENITFVKPKFKTVKCNFKKSDGTVTPTVGFGSCSASSGTLLALNQPLNQPVLALCTGHKTVNQ